MQTDEQLIEKIKTGDEVAETELFSRYKDLVVKISRSFFIVGGDLEDLVQEGMIGLYKAVKNFSPDKDASFKTFATVCIKHQIQTAIKKANTQKNIALSNSLSLQEFSCDTAPEELINNMSPDKQAIDNESQQALLNFFNNELSPKQRKILFFYISGYRNREICEMLNLRPRVVENILRRAKQKLHKYYTINHK